MKKDSPSPSYVYLKIFLVIFIFLTLVTTAYRIYNLFLNKTYDPRFYSVALIGESDTEIITVKNNNDEADVSILHIQNTNKALENKTLLEKSIVLGIPLSASIVTSSKSNDVLSFSNSLAHFFGKNEYSSERISDVDYFFISRALQKAPKDRIIEKRVQFNDIENGTIDPEQISALFRSDSVVNQKTSISVVNSSGVPGVARRVANILEATGYYVISVDSSDVTNLTSIEVARDNDQFIFNYLFDVDPIVATDKRLEDVKINIGKNSLNNL